MRKLIVWLGSMVSGVLLFLGLGSGAVGTLLMLDRRAYALALIGGAVTCLPLAGALAIRRGAKGESTNHSEALGAAGLLAFFPLIVGFGLIASSAGL